MPNEIHDAPRLTRQEAENWLKQPSHVLGMHKWYIPHYGYFVEYNPMLLSGKDDDGTEIVRGLVHWRDYHALTKSGDMIKQPGRYYIDFWTWKNTDGN